MATAARDVFINCPFDDAYREFFYAIVFTVMRSGFRARCSLETDDASENRLSKIETIIEQCRYGIHDVSRTELDGVPPLPRFNMPMELGIFLGAKRYGDKPQKAKRCIVLDRERFRYQRFLSDIAGQDVVAHNNNLTTYIEVVAGWLRRQSRRRGLPGGRSIAREFDTFLAQLPAICGAMGFEVDELTFTDYASIVAEYLAAAV